MHRSGGGRKNVLENLPREERKPSRSDGGAVTSGLLDAVGIVSNLLEPREPDYVALYSVFWSNLALSSDRRAGRTPSSGPIHLLSLPGILRADPKGKDYPGGKVGRGEPRGKERDGV